MIIRIITADDFNKGFTSVLQQLTNVGEISFEEFATALGQIQNSYIYVVEHDNSIIGTGKLLIEKKIHNNFANMGHIEDVVVDKKYRGKGIGKMIIDTLITKATEHNCYKVVANCSNENIRFYERCGMKTKGTEMCTYLN